MWAAVYFMHTPWNVLRQRFLFTTCSTDFMYNERKNMEKAIESSKLAKWISDLQVADYEDKEICEIYQNILNGIEDFPSAGELQKWIPVTESLPKVPGDYICTARWDINEPFSVSVLEYGAPVNERWIGSDRVFKNGYAFGEDWSHDGISEMDNIQEVLAWMPLPESYSLMEDF